MNNLTENHEVILDPLQKICSHTKCFTQIRKPKRNSLSLVALNIMTKYISINTELQFLNDLKHTYLEHKFEKEMYINIKKKVIFPYRINTNFSF